MPHAALTGLRALVVEDEFLIALDLESILDRLGCTVPGPAATVREALHLLVADPPDAALLDLDLFDGRSTPVAEALVARGVPFAVVSAYAAAPEPALDLGQHQHPGVGGQAAAVEGCPDRLADDRR